MIGIIGFGRFGKLVSRYLSEDFRVWVYNKTDKSSDIIKTGAGPASLQKVCAQKVVIPCVPISCLKSVLKKIRPMLNKDGLVVDVCSVKEYPVQWMTAELPETVSILATHPMFGPDSAAGTLQGSKIFLCRERITQELYDKVKAYLVSKGLIVIEGSPADHDKQIAVSLSLTHFIGRSLSEFGATELNIDTEGYKRLLHILEVVEHDTWQLFVDMNRYNPYAAKERRAFLAAMNKISDKLSR